MVGTLKLEGLNTEVFNLLRWEDDGGKNIEPDYAMPDRQFIQPVRTDAGMHDTFLPWNKQFVIEPFQARTRIDLIKRKAPTKRPSL